MSGKGMSRIRAIHAIWLAMHANWRNAVAGIAWWLRGKRVRGRNMILTTASRHANYYRHWIRFVEKDLVDCTAVQASARISVHFVLLQSEMNDKHLGAITLESIATAEAFARKRGVQTSCWTEHIGNGTQFIDWLKNMSDNCGCWVVPVVEGDTIAPETGVVLAQSLSRSPETQLAFWDEDLRTKEVRSNPWAKGAFDDLLFFGRDGLTGACAILAGQLRSLVATYGGPPNSALTCFELLASAIVDRVLTRIQHIPAVLTHRFAPAVSTESRASFVAALFARKGLGTAQICEAVPDLVQIRPILPVPAPSVCIIVPTRNRVDLLRACFEGVQELEYPGRIDFTVVDNGSDEADCLAYLECLIESGVKVLRVPGSFNFSRLNNLAVNQSDADLVCLLNNDIEPLDGDWLAIMASYALISGTGAVGALLLYPDRTVQHAGVEIGVGKGAGHAHRYVPAADPGHAWLHRSTRQASAVTAACLLVRRADYLAVGGLDEEAFPVAFNDVDFCLRLQEHGRRNIFAADAILIHHESVSRKSDFLPKNIVRFNRELNALQSKWQTDIVIDPHRSPLLANQSEQHVLSY